MIYGRPMKCRAKHDSRSSKKKINPVRMDKEREAAQVEALRLHESIG